MEESPAQAGSGPALPTETLTGQKSAAGHRQLTRQSAATWAAFCGQWFATPMNSDPERTHRLPQRLHCRRCPRRQPPRRGRDQRARRRRRRERGGGGGSTPSNEAPEFREGLEAERIIAENTPPDETVGDPIEARDRDNDPLTYSDEGVDAASFDIEATSGQLLTKAPLDYEDKSGYSVTVSVHDGKSSSGRQSDNENDFIEVTIFVTNVDEPAVVALSSDQPTIDVALIAELNDPDGSVFDVVGIWERSEDMSPH